MSRITHLSAAALLLATLSALSAPARADVEWGEVPREELFAQHFPEAPYAEAVVLFDESVVRVDEKDRLKIHRHHRTKIFAESALDRGVVRINYGKDDEIKDFRAQTIIPPGNIVEVKGDHKREVENPDGSRTLVVEFPSMQAGVVIEYRYELRRRELHTIPAWHFRGPDFTRRSRFALLIPPGMSYDATFPWVPQMPPRPQVSTVNDPENQSRVLQQVAWELTNQPAMEQIPLGGDPRQYCLTLLPQLRDFSSTYKNTTIRREWSVVGDEVAERHASFTGDGKNVKKWVEGAGASGDPSAVAETLFRRVRDDIRTDAAGADLGTSTADDMLATGSGTAAAKNVFLAEALRQGGIDAAAVLVRRPGCGPLQDRYRGVEQCNHAVVRMQLDGKEVWADASERGCPFGILPPRAQAAQGLAIASGGASALVEPASPPVTSGRETLTNATFDKNGTLHMECTVRYDGWEALAPREKAGADGGREFAEALVRDRFGKAAVLDSFTVERLENAGEPLTLSLAFRVPDYASRNGSEVHLALPYLDGLRENPLPEGERERPVHLGYAGTHEEKLVLNVPDGWSLPAAPARGRARTADLRYKVSHSLDGAALTSTRTVEVVEPVVTHDRAADVHGIFDKMVATDASELVLQRQATRTSSTR
ncbi:DUF3857 domain-containing protein [bacterium]|nr:DUF3857 domain-containing protein [bacterium]